MHTSKIIFTDKDTNLLDEVSLVLEKSGYTVYCAKDRGMAFSLSMECKPDLGIFEVRGDKSCFIDLARELYQEHAIPFIAISGLDDPEMISSALEAGAMSYLVKPINTNQIPAIIESTLKIAQDIRQLQDTEKNMSAGIQTARIISAALGILMERFQLSNKMAFELLRTEARSKQKKILDVASEILAAVETVNQFKLKINNLKENSKGG